MPLLLLDPGAMLSLEEECFRVGSVPVEAIDSIGDSFGCPVIGNINARPISPSASSAEGTSVSHSIAGAHTKDKELNGKKYGKGILKRRGSSGAVEIAQSEVKLSAETLSIHDAASLTSVQTMYHLKLIFEKPSKYLQVPYDLFVNHISDTIAQFGKGR